VTQTLATREKMPVRPATTEYRSNFMNPADSARGKYTNWHGTAPNKSLDAAVRKPFEKQITNNTLMGDWMERTKSRHFGAFGDSYPKVSPFSANKQTVKELKLPHMPKGNSRLTQSHDTPLLDSDEKYRHTYSFLLKKLQASKDSAEVTRKLPGGGKGVWRHIKQSYGTGPNLLSWVDGCRSLEDNGMMPLEPGMVPGQRPKECGGKGPNKHIVDSYGAGPNVIAWVSDANTQQTEREGSFHRVLPSLRPLKPFCA